MTHTYACELVMTDNVIFLSKMAAFATVRCEVPQGLQQHGSIGKQTDYLQISKKFYE